MKKRMIILWSAIAMSAPLLGCEGSGDECDDPDVVCECVGDIDVTVPLSSIPAKLRIVWHTGDTDLVIDECTGFASGELLYERQPDGLVINDGGFGFTPPSKFSLTVLDLKDCLADPESLVAVEDYAVPGAPHDLCSHAEVTLSE
jgi:hypothetical protein